MHQQLTLAQFNAHYFYKTELVSLCKQYGLPAYGTKAELNQYIRLYLSGEPITHIKSTRKRPPHKKLATGQLSLKTKIVGSGFKFNNEAREFFANYFGVAHFSLKKEMAIIKRRAETTHDNQLTVGDLLKLYTDMVAQIHRIRCVAKHTKSPPINGIILLKISMLVVYQHNIPIS